MPFQTPGEGAFMYEMVFLYDLYTRVLLKKMSWIGIIRQKLYEIKWVIEYRSILFSKYIFCVQVGEMRCCS